MKHPLTGVELPRFRYEPDEKPKNKHRGVQPYPRFVRVRYGEKVQIVSKCPSSLTNEQAEDLLNRGIPRFNPRKSDQYPTEIYSVLDGTVYQAVPTRLGASYHGFPALPKDLRSLPKAIKDAILDLAKVQHDEQRVQSWLDSEPEIEDV